MSHAPHSILRGLYARADALPRAMEHLLRPDHAFAPLTAEPVGLEPESDARWGALLESAATSESVRRILERRAAHEKARRQLQSWVEEVRAARISTHSEGPRAPAPLPFDWQVTASIVAAHTAIRHDAPSEEVVALLARARQAACRKRTGCPDAASLGTSGIGQEPGGTVGGRQASPLPEPWAYNQGGEKQRF